MSLTTPVESFRRSQKERRVPLSGGMWYEWHDYPDNLQTVRNNLHTMCCFIGTTRQYDSRAENIDSDIGSTRFSMQYIFLPRLSPTNYWELTLCSQTAQSWYPHASTRPYITLHQLSLYIFRSSFHLPLGWILRFGEQHHANFLLREDRTAQLTLSVQRMWKTPSLNHIADFWKQTVSVQTKIANLDRVCIVDVYLKLLLLFHFDKQ